ncbi:MAG: SGNH/GDSL hydrolase family protein [Verrucomicrobiales bacterium]|nr:SGNH/GDSL hydrolase family protein [Verrucomicrobiales bacterium]
MAFSLSRLALVLAGTALCGPLWGAEIPEWVGRTGFANLHHRCAVDKKAHVAFLGGSITQNGSGHVTMLPDWLRERYPDAEITVTNAGLSSTCSVTGAFRVAKDVLAQGPVDLFVVEFAVNDDQDAAHDRDTAIRGMEGIIRQVRSAHPAADILMVHFINPGMLEKVTAGEWPVSIAAHEAVAEHWKITSVNLCAALAASTKSGGMTWETYGGVHPGKEGYRWATDVMIRAMEPLLKAGDTPGLVEHQGPEAPLDPTSYAPVRSIDLQQISWLGGWTFAPASAKTVSAGSFRKDYEGWPMLRTTEPGAMLYVDFVGRALTAFVLAGPDAGTLEVSVDGGAWRPVTLFHAFSNQLHYPRSVVLADGLSAGFHQIALRTAEASPPGSTGTAAAILKLAIVE